ncbi:MAG: PEGA domain-containing protein, partial [bacterium]
MTLKTRRFIYIFFILIFLATAPILIVYAMGYKYNFKKNEFQKTGSFSIDSLSKGLSVYLDQELYKDKTPAKITNLLPGEYQVSLEADGYYPWQKKLT